jgi:hypothetical protein
MTNSTIETFRKTFNRSGDSVMQKAYHATYVTNDEELRVAAQKLLDMEDEFLNMLIERGIEQ